jgi:hypothetical protein
VKHKPGTTVTFDQMRKWTSSEIQEAAAFCKCERPDVWAKLQELERTTGDLTDSPAAEQQMRLLLVLHPDLDLIDLGTLYSDVRGVMRAELGLYN